MQPNFLNEIKQRYPSAELFTIPVVVAEVELPAVGQYMGRVNGSEFEGRAPETLLFMGLEGSSGRRLGRLVFVLRAEGWNTELRPETGRYERIAHVETGAPLYQSADFSELAALRAPEPPPLWTGPRELTGQRQQGQHAEARLAAYPQEGRPQTLLVLVCNRGTEPLRDLSVHWVFENEVMQPVEGISVPAQEVGGSFGLGDEESFEGTLEPGRLVPFVLDFRMLDAVLSHAAGLSPERYWLSVRSGDQEIYRVDGRVAGAHVEQLAR
jgi:hypothetical protein